MIVSCKNTNTACARYGDVSAQILSARAHLPGFLCVEVEDLFMSVWFAN